MGKNKKKVDN